MDESSARPIKGEGTETYGAELMTKEQMFTKCSFCKLFEATDKKPTGWILHNHEYTQIWYVTRGICEHWVEDQQYIMARGESFFMPPKMVHKTILREDSAIICCEVALEEVLPPSSGAESGVKIDKSVLDQIFVTLLMQRAGQMKTDFAFSPETERRVDALMNSMLREYNEEKVYYQDFLRVQIQELLLLFAREFELSPDHDTSVVIYNKNRGFVERAIDYIESHYPEQLTLEDACKISTLSKTYFCYLFKLMTQKTFIEYVMQLRIQKAMQLLEDPLLSITYIGEAVGFNDSTHFSRTFRKMVGMSPRSFRTLKLTGRAAAE